MERVLLILGLLYLGIVDAAYGAAVSITTASLPNGTTNQPYSYTVIASGGTLPYTWSASGLPAGLSINSSTGVISGTPTCGGANSCDAPSALITVQDSLPSAAKASFPFSILNDITDTVVPAATATPLQQIAGDMFQILNPNYQSETSAYGQPTNGLYNTQAGVWGMDEGVCTLFPNNSEFCIYGDTITVYWDPNISGTHCAGTPGVGCWQDFQFIDTCQNNGPQTGGRSNCLGQKAMSLTAGVGGNPPDYSTCGAIAGVDTGLTNNLTPTISYAGCPSPTYITNSSHSSTQPRMASQNVSGLIADADGIGEVTVAGHTPDTALVVGSNLYIEWNMTRTPTPAESGIVGSGGYLNESVWLNCGATSSITSVLSAELPCSRVSTWSQAPYLVAGLASPAKGATTITAASGSFASYMSTSGAGTGEYNLIFVDGDNQQAYSITSYTDATHIVISPAYSGPGGVSIHWNIFPNQETNIGKFIDSSSTVFTVAGLPWVSLLPSALQSASQIVCSFGSSFAWRASNLYLMCFDAAYVNSLTYSKNATRTNQVNGAPGGITQAYYLTGLTAGGIPSWTQGAEQLAIPLLHTYQHTCLSKFVPSGEMCFNIGKPSVRYSPGLQRFVFTYGSGETQGLLVRTSATPWGPWSVESQLLPNDGELGSHSWESKMLSPNNGGYRFNLSQAKGLGPHNQPISCPSCSGGFATGLMYDAVSPKRIVTAKEFSTLDDGGNWYAPYQYTGSPGERNFGNGTVGLYFHASGFNAYVPYDFVVVMTQPKFQGSGGTRVPNVSEAGGVR